MSFFHPLITTTTQFAFEAFFSQNSVSLQLFLTLQQIEYLVLDGLFCAESHDTDDQGEKLLTDDLHLWPQ